MKFIFVYPIFHWGDIVGKVLPKAWGSEKIQNGGGDDHIVGVVYRKGRGSSLLHTMVNESLEIAICFQYYVLWYGNGY